MMKAQSLAEDWGLSPGDTKLLVAHSTARATMVKIGTQTVLGSLGRNHMCDALEQAYTFGGTVKKFLDSIKVVITWPIPFLVTDYVNPALPGLGFACLPLHTCLINMADVGYAAMGLMWKVRVFLWGFFPLASRYIATVLTS